ncbi:hypothetical protein WR25_25006 [Diploscapter pachys]|uniref:DUF2171 domain-containing protein n=1 Tax=Diploscapter pachys TaxID=2018661 RepID=A0A2A2KMC8_9BILA|nr:hypothetical protein WR25_25006 [Diploscapter pachys]
MKVIGADGVHVGTVDHVEGERIKLTKTDSPSTEDGQGAKHHYLPAGLVAEIEGDTVRLRDNRSDRGHDAFEVPHHIGIGEADHVIAFVLEEAGAGGVAFDFGGMVVAVDFDDQSYSVRAEIGMIRAERNLTAELCLGQSLAQGPPEAAFGFAGFLTERARAGYGRGRQLLPLGQAVRIPPHPSHGLRPRAPSLSHKGRGRERRGRGRARGLRHAVTFKSGDQRTPTPH